MSINARIDRVVTSVRESLESADVPTTVVDDRLLALQGLLIDWTQEDRDRIRAEIANIKAQNTGAPGQS